MAIEVEVRFTAGASQLLLIGWTEGSGSARLVVNGPADEREEIQIASISASLQDVVESAISEPPPKANRSAKVTAHLRLATPRARAGRTIELVSDGTETGFLCAKLLAMAELLVTEDEVKKALASVRAKSR